MKNSIPKGWIQAELDAVTDIVSKVNPKENPNNRFKYLDIASIDNTIYKITSPKDYIGKEAPSRARQLVKSGDILFSTVRTYLKNIALVEDKYDGQIASTGFCVIRPILMNNKYIFYFMFLKSFLDSLTKMQRGTSYPAVRNSDVFAQSIPIPPLPEQHRIVAKVEELFTKLDAGVDALKQMQAQLKRYRQSVLKAAVEGRLTAEWREQHKDELEPADKLLERNLKERREMWEGEKLASYETQGKNPPKDWQNKYKKPTPPDVENLPKLSEGWTWGTWNQISNWVTYGFTKPMPHVEAGFPIVTAKNVKNQKILFSNTHKTNKEAYESLSMKDKPTFGDILLTKDGTIGKAALVTNEHDAFCINQSVAVIWLRTCSIDRKFLLAVIESPLIQEPIFKKARGVALKHLSISDFAKLPLPIPSSMEQRIIVEKTEKLLSIIEESELVIESELKRAQSLRQSILKRAFEGKLVPQDTNDEPSSMLLKKIKAEKGIQTIGGVLNVK